MMKLISFLSVFTAGAALRQADRVFLRGPDGVGRWVDQPQQGKRGAPEQRNSDEGMGPEDERQVNGRWVPVEDVRVDRHPAKRARRE